MNSHAATIDPPTESLAVDRPGWIPPHITANWDPDPYAYQTEEELMPAGGPHGQLLTYIVEILRHVLETQDLMFLVDTFMLYRDNHGVKRRVAPDLLLMPYRSPAPRAYDLDIEPPPFMTIEVTSQDSHLSDLRQKNGFYLGLGIPTYLVIDAITPEGAPCPQIELHLWRLIHGQIRQISPNATGTFFLPEIGFGVRADGRRIRFLDPMTGEPLLDSSELSALVLEEREARRQEQQARFEAEAKAARLVAELNRLKNER
ncbi:Uma2 family endonuclease [Chloroflexi bacterium TSY]|nr:Uma2 family endonuclease [Chloroflexi bacterium TSY]